MPAENLLIVTGASTGIGLAIARAVPFPARVVDVSRTGPPADAGIEHLPADLADPGSWMALGGQLGAMIAETRPKRALCVHAAGTLQPIGFAGEVDSEAYARNVLLNSAAGQMIGHLFIAAVHAVPGTHDLVMISSGAANTAYAGWSAYCAGKAALDHWVRAVGEEQRHRGNVRVAAIAPGVVATAMQEQIRTTSRDDFPAVARFRELHDEHELADPAEVAEKFWRVVEAGLSPGSVIDLRSL